jgi:hypothetical protein
MFERPAAKAVGRFFYFARNRSGARYEEFNGKMPA